MTAVKRGPRRRRRPCVKVRYPSAEAARAALRALPPGRLESRVQRCARHVRPTWHLTKRVTYLGWKP